MLEQGTLVILVIIVKMLVPVGLVIMFEPVILVILVKMVIPVTLVNWSHWSSSNWFP